MKRNSCCLLGLILSADFCVYGQVVHGAAVIRHYPMELGLAVNPEDPGDPGGEWVEPALGLSAAQVFNENSLDFTWDLSTPVGSEPIFVEGRTGQAGDLAVYFDGSRPDMELEPSADNPPTQLNGRKLCPWCPDADSEAALLAASDGHVSTSYEIGYQAWVKADLAGHGSDQVVFAAGGGDTGGVGITAEGNWAHLSPSWDGEIQIEDSGVPVAFGEWTHVGTILTHNQNALFINGAAASGGVGAVSFSGVGDMTVGARDVSGANAFIGSVDDLKMRVTSRIVGGFSPLFDLDYFGDTVGICATGDVDQDGSVGISDYDIWAANFGFDNGIGIGDPSTLFKGDVDQNGVVNFADLSIIKLNARWAGTPIPEPASLALVGFGLLTLARRRKANAC